MVNYDVTYGQLDRLLRDLGFTVRKVKPRWKCYDHPHTDAMIVLADVDPSETAIPSSIVSTRNQLILRGFVSEPELDEMLATNGKRVKKAKTKGGK